MATHFNTGAAIIAAQKSNPNLINDGRKRVEQFAENERDRIRNEKLKKKIKEFIFGKSRE